VPGTTLSGPRFAPICGVVGSSRQYPDLHITLANAVEIAEACRRHETETYAAERDAWDEQEKTTAL
jgi:hypothetical protein